MYKRSMGLDVGDARIGVALSDPLGMFAHPHDTVDNTGRAAIDQIVAIIEEMDVNNVILGLPLELSGNHGDQAQKVEKFAASLEKAINSKESLSSVKLHFRDERLSSIAAERAIIGSKLKNRERRAQVDKVAAALILESYLNAQSA